jgi:hypothetical protein
MSLVWSTPAPTDMVSLRESFRVAVTAEPRAELHRMAAVSPQRGDAIGGETPEELPIDQRGGHRPSVTRGQHRGVE